MLKKIGRPYAAFINQKYGSLIIKNIFREYLNKQECTKCTCLCDCGNTKVILLSNLKRGTTKSCGCGHRGRPLGKFYTPSGQTNSKRVIAAYKHSAKNRELTFNLSDSQIYDLCQRNCYYCGASPSNIKNDKRCNGVFIYNGIDRMDNTKGYTLNNVQSCCRQCNTAKNILSINEFKDWIKKVYNNVNGI